MQHFTDWLNIVYHFTDWLNVIYHFIYWLTFMRTFSMSSCVNKNFKLSMWLFVVYFILCYSMWYYINNTVIMTLTSVESTSCITIWHFISIITYLQSHVKTRFQINMFWLFSDWQLRLNCITVNESLIFVVHMYVSWTYALIINNVLCAWYIEAGCFWIIPWIKWESSDTYMVKYYLLYEVWLTSIKHEQTWQDILDIV